MTLLVRISRGKKDSYSHLLKKEEPTTTKKAEDSGHVRISTKHETRIRISFHFNVKSNEDGDLRYVQTFFGMQWSDSSIVAVKGCERGTANSPGKASLFMW